MQTLCAMSYAQDKDRVTRPHPSPLPLRGRGDTNCVIAVIDPCHGTAAPALETNETRDRFARHRAETSRPHIGGRRERCSRGEAIAARNSARGCAVPGRVRKAPGL